MHFKQESEQCEQFGIFWDTCREEIDLLKFVIFHSIFRDGYKFDGTIPVHYWRLGTPRTHRKESSNNLYICHLYQTKYLLLTVNVQYLGNQERAKNIFLKLRQGSGKDRQGMAVKAKGLKA